MFKQRSQPCKQKSARHGKINVSSLAAQLLCRRTHQQQGFALPLAIGMGLVMLTLAFTSVLVSQNSRNAAWQRKEVGASLTVTEGGMARSLVQLMAPNNAILLTRDYDPINPETSKNYLGKDGIPNSGDEGVVKTDNWTGYSSATSSFCNAASAPLSPDIEFSGSIGNSGQYNLLAYRYDSLAQEGTLLVEGQHDGSTSYVLILLAIESVTPDFPGVVSENSVYLRGRSISGQNSNIYYQATKSGDPSLKGSAAPNDAARANYLNAIYSTAADGPSADSVDGKIMACDIALTIPTKIPDNAFSIETLATDTALSTAKGPYRIQNLDLDDDIVTVDTTAGPVEIYVTDTFTLRGNAQLRNIRTDGKPPQVGDLRIFVDTPGGIAPAIQLYDQSCIDMAFLYNTTNDLEIQTTGDGCPSSGNSNFDGVVWAEDVWSSINNPATPENRKRPSDENEFVMTTNGVTSGISVPDDVSGLSDVVNTIGLTPTYKLGYIKQWQRVRL